MPNKNYDYTLSVDFAVNNTYDPDKFKDELIALNLTSANFLHIDRKGDIVSVWYDGDLSAPDITSLIAAVATHDGIPYGLNGWIPPNISLGEAVTSGATTYLNAGAGVQMSFDSASDDEISFNIVLACGGLPYDGVNLKLCYNYGLFTTTPVAGNNIKLSVRYAFILADGTENPETKLSGSFEDTIDVSELSEDTCYTIDSSVLIGVPNSKHLQLTIQRNSLGGEADTYPDALDLFSLCLEKV